MLKALDVVVSVKVAVFGEPGWTIATLARALDMDDAQSYRSLRQATAAGLLASNRVGTRVSYRAHHAALIEFISHGARYTFPLSRGGFTRGMPTAYAAPVMAAHVTPGADPPPVWPEPEGTTRGEGFAPLHRCVPSAAHRDPAFYAIMALIDVFRAGRPRERAIASTLLPEILGAHAR